MPHYFSKKQDSELNLKKIKIVLKERTFELYSGSGIFSKDKVDNGTKLLLDTLDLSENTTVLDLGCGIGVIGIYVKMKYPSSNVFMSDVNKRAVSLAKKNIKLHKLTDIYVKESDSFSKIDQNFDVILLNPPQTAGKDVCFNMIEESYKHLNKKGSFLLVARHQKGGKHLSSKMEDIFSNVSDIAKGSGFRVYKSIKE